MPVNRHCNFRGQKCGQERSVKGFKIDLKVEIQRMWAIQTNVLPAITGATGTNS